MDCRRSYEERHGFTLSDVCGLRRELSHMDDVQALSDAAFSQCRYIIYWAMGPCDDLVEWLKVVLARLEKVASGTSGGAPVVVEYRFAGTAERVIRDFCERVLSGEAVPWRVEYRVSEMGACDAYMDEVEYLLEMHTGDVSLGLTVMQTTWRFDWRGPENLAPEIGDVRAWR